MFNLKVWQKLSLVGVLLSLPIMTLVYLFVQGQNKQISTTMNERDGLEYVSAVRLLQEQVPQHRAVANGFLNGETGMRAQLPVVESRIEAAISAVDAVDNKYGERFGTTEMWGRWKAQWHDLQKRTSQLSAKESFDLHTKVIADVMEIGRAHV